MLLNEDQQKVFNACMHRSANIFCTGEGGTGKSRLLSKVVNEFRTNDKYKDVHIAVTAPTGLSAFNIGGVTLHSFAGVQIIENNLEEMIKRARKGASYTNWIDTNILIIDEISMISATFFDNLSRVAQNLRKSNEPFGGIRIIMFGDFLQLPPVSKNNSRANKVFESSTWQIMSVECFTLSEIIRQSDLSFKTMLSSFRRGVCSDDDISYMKSLSRSLQYDDSIEPVKLFPRRNNVDMYNSQRLDLIKSNGYTYYATDYGDYNLLKHCIVPKSIVLKVGAQVMITRNLSKSIFNGSIGVVTGFEYDNTSKLLQPIVSVIVESNKCDNITLNLCSWECIGPNGKKTIAKRTQIPVILAWATTIHKSQGQTIPRLSVDLEGVFECGQAYVALSRAVSSDGLQVVNFTKSKIRADPESVKFYERLEKELENNDVGYNIIVSKSPRSKIFIGFGD